MLCGALLAAAALAGCSPSEPVTTSPDAEAPAPSASSVESPPVEAPKPTPKQDASAYRHDDHYVPPVRRCCRALMANERSAPRPMQGEYAAAIAICQKPSTLPEEE